MNNSIDLSGFYGTEKYYRHALTSSVYTDGVQYFAEQARWRAARRAGLRCRRGDS